MGLRLQSGRWLLTLMIGAGLALLCAAQNPRTDRAQSRQENKPPKEQRQQQNQQRRQEQRQERRQPQQEARRAQPERRNAEPLRNPATVNPPQRSGNSRDGGSRPPNRSGENVQRPNFNENRPPNVTGRSRDLTPEERQRFQRD